MQIPEKAQADALQRVAELGSAHAQARDEAKRLKQLLREAALEAVRVGAERSRVRELADVGNQTLYDWLSAEGMPMRPKRRRTKEPAP